MITLLNTPARLERINEFKCKLVIKNVAGLNKAVIEFSEEVVITPEVLEALDTVSEAVMIHSAATAPVAIEQRLTSLMRSFLLLTKTWFVGEVDADIVLGMEQVAQTDEEGMRIYNIVEGD